MILIFKKLNGRNIAIDVDSVLEINDKIDYTEIKTVVRNIKLDHEFAAVVNLIAQYQSSDDNGINYSKN